MEKNKAEINPEFKIKSLTIKLSNLSEADIEKIQDDISEKV